MRKSLLRQMVDKQTWDAQKYFQANKELRTICLEPVYSEEIKNGDRKIEGYQVRNKEFRVLFDKGFEQYVKGRWADAKSIFEQAQKALLALNEPEDGPTTLLLEVMRENNFKPYEKWKGYRNNDDL